MLDFVLPEMSGHQPAQHLWPLRPDMKVLYLPGYSDEAIVQRRLIDPDHRSCGRRLWHDIAIFVHKLFERSAFLTAVMKGLGM